MQTPDAIKHSIIDYAPLKLRPFLRLSRFDRPIGFWLLALPCFMGHLLGRINIGFSVLDLKLVILWIIGAIVMRGAGCTINDIVDKDFDEKVERTRNRPIPSGQVSIKAAYIWLGLQLLIGLGVLYFLPPLSQIIALCAVPLIVLYPFMKRITWWPQVFLGIVFNWGVLVGYASVTGTIDFNAILFWLGTMFWTLGYDTVYAMSDIEDDALIGVKSSARKLGKNAPEAVFYFYLIACLIFSFSILLIGKYYSLVALYFGYLFVWYFLNNQIIALNNGETDYTKLFREHKKIGIGIVTTLLIAVVFSTYVADFIK